jgi:molybdopterin biosynthesis enzyme
MGTRDHVKDVIHHMGGKIHFGRVNIKPGKPVAFASMLVDDKHKFVFSLPGNPVSAFVTSLVMVNPFLKHGPESFLSSQKQLAEHLGETILAKVEVIEDTTGREVYKFDGRCEFLRARISCRKMEFVENKPVYFVKVSVKQHSSRLLGLLDCDCLMMIDPSKKGQVLQEGLIYPALKLNRKF